MSGKAIVALIWASFVSAALILTGCKLLGAISWSWWWVLSPIWIPLALAFVLLVLATILAHIVFADQAEAEEREMQYRLRMLAKHERIRRENLLNGAECR